MPIAPSLEATHQQVVYTFFMGMVFSVLSMRTGTVFYAILFHVMNNVSPWTPTSDLSSVSSWGNLLVIYGLAPLVYTLWCLRPNKVKLDVLSLNREDKGEEQRSKPAENNV